MATIMSNEILDVVLSLRGNPGRTQQYILNLMERLSGGDAIAIDHHGFVYEITTRKLVAHAMTAGHAPLPEHPGRLQH